MTQIVIGNATLYHGDCREILPTLPKVDAVVTDPPYGINYKHGKGGGKLAQSTKFDNHPIIGDDQPFDPSALLNFQQIVLFGANHFANKLPNSPFWLIWDKRNGIGSNDQADVEMAWVKSKGQARIIHHLWNGMLKASEKGQERVHPTQKPIAVMEWVLKTANITSTVLDPYMGSGTTGIACMNVNLPFIGIEIDKTYFDIACERIAAAQAQGRLFE